MTSNLNATALPHLEHALSDRQPMRAIVQSGYGSTDVLQLGSIARPQPKAGEVLVRVHAAGLDRGTWHLMTGRPYLMRVMGFGFSTPKEPVPGLDLAGTVVEVGEGVTRFRVGDHVLGIGQGSFAEYARAREDRLVLKPSSLCFEHAAVLSVSGITALQSLRAGGVREGERVLIIGASGGVGTFMVQLAKAFGAHVTGVCSTSKVATVRALGADHVIDYTRDDFSDGATKYDLIMDVGGNTPLRRLRRAMTSTGRLVFVGGENGGDWTAGFGRNLHALALNPFGAQRFIMHTTREHYESVAELVALSVSHRIEPVVDRQVPLALLTEAMRELEAGRVCGKVVVTA